MRRAVLVICSVAVVLLMSMGAFAQMQEDIQKYPTCKYCGMDRQQFAYSRMLIEYDDGTGVGTCSLHCAAIDIPLNLDKSPKALLVGDYNSKKLIDAEAAIWVLGGTKPGVMTKRAKWAFEKKEDADKFVQGNQGTVVSFDEAIKAAYEDMYADTQMIRDKRKMMKMKMMDKKQ